MQNPWHDLSPGADAPHVVNAIIENNPSSKGKFELHKESGMLILDRVLFSSMRYPANYGFIPGTYCDDNDPLDILVISQVDLPFMSLVEARIVGAFEMLDRGEGDDKIIAVADKDPHFKHVQNLSDLPPHLITEIKSFFEDYKKLENKEVEVTDLFEKDKALEIVKKSIDLYKKTFK